MVGHWSAEVQFSFLLPAMHHAIDVGGHLAPYNCAHKAHQPLRLAQVAALDRLNDDKEGVVNAVVQFLGAKLAAQKEANAPGEDPVEILHPTRIPTLDAIDEIRPVYAAGSLHRFFARYFRFRRGRRLHSNGRYSSERETKGQFLHSQHFLKSFLSNHITGRPIFGIGPPVIRPQHIELREPESGWNGPAHTSLIG